MMKYALLVAAGLLVQFTPAMAQDSPPPPTVFKSGAVVDTHCASWSGTTGKLVDTGATCGTGGGVGTITGVTAGTGLSGGGTVGAVTINLTTPVAIANGGSGQTTAGAALTAFGGAPLASPTFTGTVTTPALTLSGFSTGCLTNTSGVISSTGVACGSGGSGTNVPSVPVTTTISNTADTIVINTGGSGGTTKQITPQNFFSQLGTSILSAPLLGTDVSGNLQAITPNNGISETGTNLGLAALAANQLLGSLTAVSPTGLTVPSCSGASNALTWTSGTGFGCNTISGGGGGVSSVGLSMPGIFSVTGSPVTTSGTLTATASGTSGGIPYFSSGTTLASSAALTANAPVIGGGAGVAPTVGTRSGNTTTFGTTSGTLTNGHCVSLDASGNLVDAGGACTTGGGGGTVASSTVNSVAVYTGATTVTGTGPLTNGQLLVGSTGSAPVAASLTAGSNITITPGAGSITIAASGGGSSGFGPAYQTGQFYTDWTGPMNLTGPQSNAYIYFKPFVAQSSSTVLTLSATFGAGTSGTFCVGLASDSGGLPNLLISQSCATPTASTTQTFTLSPSIALTAGQVYWTITSGTLGTTCNAAQNASGSGNYGGGGLSTGWPGASTAAVALLQHGTGRRTTTGPSTTLGTTGTTTFTTVPNDGTYQPCLLALGF